MKLRILYSFVDKYTDEEYAVGDIIEVTKTRGEELLSSRVTLVEIVEEEQEEKDTEKPKKKRTKKAKE